MILDVSLGFSTSHITMKKVLSFCLQVSFCIGYLNAASGIAHAQVTGGGGAMAAPPSSAPSQVLGTGPGGNSGLRAAPAGTITIDTSELFLNINPINTNITAAFTLFESEEIINLNTTINPLLQNEISILSNFEEVMIQVCAANRKLTAQNSFTIEGRGGIIPEPGSPLNSNNIYVDGETDSASSIRAPIETAQGKIQPARGIKVAEDGTIILTAYRTNNAGDRLPDIKPNCS